ncbi:peptidylprolyl isomerase [Paenibacillus sp. P96]|uniref:Peptidylprolyl isomerase n=1 Tax=Paenibacillus zeirhizosphaerae TaxID=2987519 RepID=A0ABT9FWS7_9BACL|nr:peptidylprolyl isomerase [Paenibacillus sp. P96]MDP4099183.1 peptidylprolyl isomerase [Paenibacillus sp. P96]
MLPNKAGSWKTLLLSLVVVLTVSLLAACGKDGEQSADKTPKDTSKVVATYNGGEITENEFNREISMMKLLYPDYAQMLDTNDVRQTIVKQEIAYEYLASKADENAKTAGAKSGQEQFDQFKGSVGADQFKTMLDAQKLTEANVKDYLTNIMTVTESEKAKITDEQLKSEFAKNEDQFTTASVRHVLINFTDPKTNKERTKEATLKLAKEVQAKLKDGADFAEIAKKYSEDPGSAENGGLYENTPVGQWVEAFKEAAKTQPLNEVGDPIETEYGYHIIKVESRTMADYAKLTAEQKDSLVSSVVSEKVSNFMTKDLDALITKIELPAAPTAPAAPAAENGTDSGKDASTGSTDPAKSGSEGGSTGTTDGK